MEWRALVFFSFSFFSKRTLVFITKRKKTQLQVIKRCHGKAANYFKGTSWQSAHIANCCRCWRRKIRRNSYCACDWMVVWGTWRETAHWGNMQSSQKGPGLTNWIPWPCCREATVVTTAPPLNQRFNWVWIEPDSCYAENATFTWQWLSKCMILTGFYTGMPLWI